MEIDKIYNMDCLDGMKQIPDDSVDAIICDLPYGTTRNSWDSIIPLEPLWKEYERIAKKRAAIVLFSQMPFSAMLVASNPKLFKYEWVWVKESPTGFLNSNFAPLKVHENILIFSKSSAAFVRDKAKAMNYFAQMRPGKAYSAKQGAPSTNYDNKRMREPVMKNYKAERYPLDVVKFQRDRNSLHPTQKPVELVRYLIRTYSEVGGVILDNCMGSGTTAVAAIQERRRFIGAEADKKYFEIAQERIAAAR